MPPLADIWSSLFTIPTLVVTITAGIVVALFTFILNRIAHRIDNRERNQAQPSRRNIRAGRRFLQQTARRPRRIAGPDRWSLIYNTSLGAYELTQHGPDIVHDLRIDFFNANATKQKQLSPTVQVRQLWPNVPLTMALGATTQTHHYAMAIRWADSFGAEQFDKIRLVDAHRR